jgi:hypothetical protein
MYREHNVAAYLCTLGFCLCVSFLGSQLYSEAFLVLSTLAVIVVSFLLLRSLPLRGYHDWHTMKVHLFMWLCFILLPIDLMLLKVSASLGFGVFFCTFCTSIVIGMYFTSGPTQHTVEPHVVRARQTVMNWYCGVQMVYVSANVAMMLTNPEGVRSFWASYIFSLCCLFVLQVPYLLLSSFKCGIVQLYMHGVGLAVVALNMLFFLYL